MNKPKIKNRFSLNKRTVAHLNNEEMRGVRGGCELTLCISGSAALRSSTVVIITTEIYPYNYPAPCYEEPITDTDPS